MPSTSVHLVAGLLALLTSVPYPARQKDASDKLENVKWLSYNLLTRVVDAFKGSSPSKNETLNNLGAAVFVIYAAVAWYFTIRLSWRLARLSQRIPDAQYPAKASFYGCMAFFSFTIMSFNVFLFLVDSFLTFAEKGRSRIKTGDFTWLGLALDIWQWIADTPILFNFARGLCKSNGGYWWSAQALLTTMLSTLYMSATSQEHSIVDNLDFFLLSQLLPVSFAQNLFFVALLIRPISQEMVAAAAAPSASTNSSPRILPESAVWALLVAYRVLIAYLPLTAAHPWQLLVALLAARMLPLLNYFVSFNPGTALLEALPWALLYRVPFILVGTAWNTTREEVLASFTTNFAVNTLSIDHVVWLCSVVLFFVWDWVDRVTTERFRRSQQDQVAKQ